MKILYYASIPFFYKPNPSYHLMTAMIEDLLLEGHDVFFVGQKLPNLNMNIPKSLEDNPRFRYELIAQNPINKSQFAIRYLYGIIYAIKSIKSIRKFACQCDIVFIQSSATALYKIIVTKIFARNKPIIYNVQDMFPGSSIASGVMKQKWMQKCFYLLQRIAYKNSDIIVGISEDMRQKLLKERVPSDKIRIIVNWFDDTKVHEIKWNDNSIVKKYSLCPEYFYVQYAGTMGYVFDYMMVIEVAKILCNETSIVFQMIGEGSQKSVFEKRCKDEGLTNIQFLPLEPVDFISDVYSSCHICYIPLKQGVIGNSVPSKAGVVMACKRPIITTVDNSCHFANEINNNHIGYAFPTDSPVEVANAIKYLSLHRDLCAEMGINAFKYGRELYSRKNNMRKYLDLFNELFSN